MKKYLLILCPLVLFWIMGISVLNAQDKASRKQAKSESRTMEGKVAVPYDIPKSMLRSMTTRSDTPLQHGNARIVLTVGDIWGDGSGYQLLLDKDANAYGTIIPANGHLTESADAPQSVYDEFEYKIPVNADGVRTTANIVRFNTISIDVPAGTYDFCFVNPLPTSNIFIASNNGNIEGRVDDYTFDPGKIYTFTVKRFGDYDGVDIVITSTFVPLPVADFTAIPDPAKNLSCALSWTNPTQLVIGDPIGSFDVVIRRNNTQIASIASGGTGTYTDTPATAGSYTYTILAKNAEGESEIKTETVWVGPTPCDTPISVSPSWKEDFEDFESTGTCWSEEFVEGTSQWRIREGASTGSDIRQAHSGTKNLCFFNGITKIISPKLDISTLDKPTLSFWHAQQALDEDQDELRVYYKNAESGEWKLLAEITDDVPEWTEKVLLLPEKSADYYIAFEGTAEWGYGVAVDDVSISGASYEVTYNSQGGSAVALVYCLSGGKVKKPSPDPTKLGYDFGGWYKESACTNAWDFETNVVSEDITLYAKWTLSNFIITLPAVEGVSYDKNTEAERTIVSGNDFTFRISLAEGYSKEGMIISANNGYAVIDNGDGSYTLKNVTHNINVTITGVKLFFDVSLDLVLDDPELAQYIYINPAEGIHKIEKGKEFSFYIFLEDECDLSEIEVKANGTTLAPNGDGLRVMDYSYKFIVNAKVEIKIYGIKKNPAGIENMKAQTAKIYAIPGSIVIEQTDGLLLNTEARIYTINGMLNTTTRITDNKTTIRMPKGIYLVELNGKVAKVVVN